MDVGIVLRSSLLVIALTYLGYLVGRDLFHLRHDALGLFMLVFAFVGTATNGFGFFRKHR